MDTYHNKIASRNIFLDWKTYVENSFKSLVDRDLLWELPGQMGLGTDGIEHPYTEYYTDPAMQHPLVDYSYMYDEAGNLRTETYTVI